MKINVGFRNSTASDLPRIGAKTYGMTPLALTLI